MYLPVFKILYEFDLNWMV